MRTASEEEQFADAAEEADDVRVAQRVTFLVAHRFQELVDPDRGVDRQTFLVQRFDLDRARARLHHRPEAGDTHGGVEREKVLRISKRMLCEDEFGGPEWHGEQLSSAAAPRSIV